MPISIDDGFMRLETDGGMVATLDERAGAGGGRL
jgi:hypothetical protein